MTTIIRNYVHKTHGEIGTAKLEIPEGTWKLNGVELEPGAIEYLANFALQTGQDAYASSKTREEAVAAWEKRIERIQTDSIGMREGGNSEEPWLRFARAIIRAQLNARKDEYKALSTQSERDDMLNDIFDSLPGDVQSAIETDAKADLEAYRAEQKRKAEKAKKVAAKIDTTKLGL